MSSYIIAKEEYIKAAGVIAGLAETLGGRMNRIWIYDYETRRNSTPGDYHRKFSEFYTMNCLSVIEQYRGDEVGAPANDNNDYMDTFKKYQNYGQQIGYTRENLKEVVLELHSFFRSALYQTENDVYNTKMTYFFNQILEQLLPLVLNGYETKSWRALELPEIKTRVTRIM